MTTEPLLAVLLKEHDLVSKKSIDLWSLRDFLFTLFKAGFGLDKSIIEACRRRGFEPPVVARRSRIDFILELAAAGLGAAFLPRMILAEHSHEPAAPVLLAESQTESHIALIAEDCLSALCGKGLACLGADALSSGSVNGATPTPLRGRIERWHSIVRAISHGEIIRSRPTALIPQKLGLPGAPRVSPYDNRSASPR